MAASNASNPIRAAQQRRFTADVEEMLFGFGDQWPPDHAAVSMIECLVEEYVSGLAQRAAAIGEVAGVLDKECFLFLVRADERKFHRIQRLLKAHREIKQARSDKKVQEEQPSDVTGENLDR
jgi:hypothetical protein